MRNDRRSLVVGGSLAALLAMTGCQTPGAAQDPSEARTVTVGLAAKPDAPGHGGGKKPPGGGADPTSRTITIDAGAPLHTASPFVTGFNRNHSHGQFAYYDADRQALIQATLALRPAWGDAYLAGLRDAGYPAPARPTYLYRTGHGPTDGRKDYAYMKGYFFDHMWGLAGQYPDGTDPSHRPDGYPYDDVRYPIREADDMGAGLLVTVNFGTDTADSAGRLAGYLNRPTDPLRDQYPYFGGAGTPRGAFMFEIGNEMSHAYARGRDEKAFTVAQYASNAAPYIEAIRGASPHKVKIALASAVNIYWGAQAGWAQRGEMVRSLIREADARNFRFDALQAHLYPSWPVSEPMAGNAYSEGFLTQVLIPVLDQEAGSPNADLKIWNDELHAASGSTIRNTGLYGALFQADATVLAFRTSRHGKQLIPVITDFGWWHAGTNYDSLYFQDNDAGKKTPIYHFRRMLAGTWGDWILPTSVAGVGAWTDRGQDGQTTAVSNLSAVSALSADGGTLTLLVVNRSNTDEQVMVRTNGFTASTVASLKRIEGTMKKRQAWDAAWNQIALREGEAVDLTAAVSFPKASISFLTIRRAE